MIASESANAVVRTTCSGTMCGISRSCGKSKRRSNENRRTCDPAPYLSGRPPPMIGYHHQHGSHSADGHDHHGSGHTHAHAPKMFAFAFAFGIAFNTLFVIIEAIYGVIGHSTALIADAGHNLSDVLGLLIAWAAAWLSRRAPTTGFTYGLRSTSILAALFNAMFLLAAVGAIAGKPSSVSPVRNRSPGRPS